MVVGEDIPQALPHQFGHFLVLPYWTRLVLAPDALQRGFGWRLVIRRRRLAAALQQCSELFEMPMKLQLLLEDPLNRRMETRQQRRAFPALRRNIREHISPGKTMRK